MNDKYEILWKEPKAKQGYFKTHSVVVYGLDAVEHVLETLLKDVQNYAESFMDFNSLVENYVETVEKEVMIMF